MQSFKKYISTLGLVLVMAFTLSACTGGTDDNNDTDPTNDNGPAIRANSYGTWLYFTPSYSETEGRFKIDVVIDGQGTLETVDVSWEDLESVDQEILTSFETAAESFATGKKIQELAKNIEVLNNDPEATEMLQKTLKLIYNAATN